MKTPQLPVPQLAKKIGLSTDLWLKREDLHHYGSHKGRSIPLMIAEYAKRHGLKNFVISSSGNAALAAVTAVQTHNKSKPHEPLKLTIFVGLKINSHKLAVLKKAIIDPNIKLQQITEPKQAAFQAGQAEGVKLLRQSTDDLALRGYADLAKELSKIEGLSAIFVPTSSGATAQGLAMGFKQTGIIPELHVIQTPNCHPIVDAIYLKKGKKPASDSSEISLAQAIVDQLGHRKDLVAEAVIESNGEGWIVTNQEITQTIELVKQTINISISPTSALSIAALTQAIQNNHAFQGPVVCLITGN